MIVDIRPEILWSALEELLAEMRGLVVISCLEPRRFVAVKRTLFASLQFEFEFESLGSLTHVRTKRFFTGPLSFIWGEGIARMGAEQSRRLIQIANRLGSEVVDAVPQGLVAVK